MYSPRSQGGEYGTDARKYDPNTAQWMREAMESRVTIEELKAQNDKLQREIYGLNSKLNLMYECCADLGIVDRLGDMMQRKLHEFQAAQMARNEPPATKASAAQVHPIASPLRAAKKSDLGKSDEGFICGSSTFQDVAAYSSSYKGQISRGNFHRVRVIEAEEAKLRDQFDIFGVPKLPQQKADRCSSTESDNKTGGDTIDKLLISEATNSPRRSARQEPQYLYEPAIPVPSRAQGKL
ncbi:hypothetical protein PPTG_18440 [Phytophthora nicotianae INRA-310]|uniref:Uncharacterized protein n=1 Tax=Phytophthora nicotianae (strain INRA-310) TaxID=761204 RepID=W2PFU6_PHYN3|nr:hypothetical protein PPTG_18440 [Phytophthora nicotianae INRA-310]ETM99897.1 hypothetical protein PPTG_18440 [Phytophthora nicotianae INRA-310]